MVTPLLILAGNPSAWTGPSGNNTWLLRGAEPALVDAGVGRPEHVDAIARALDGVPLARVLITHSHSDHVAGLRALARAAGLSAARGGSGSAARGRSDSGPRA
jgi:glyoxylase-like metal-dependent hydrolase (beta-lactamase superfamily II)